MPVRLRRPAITPAECLAIWNGHGNAGVRAATRPPRGPVGVYHVAVGGVSPQPVPDGPYDVYAGPIHRVAGIAEPPPGPTCCVWFRWAGDAATPAAMLAITTTPALDGYSLAKAVIYRGAENTSLTGLPRVRQLDDGSLVLDAD